MKTDLIFLLNFLQIKIRGEAEAFAIAAKAKAEAEQMAQKAEAWREYREAAMVEMLLDTLPKVYAYKIDEKKKLRNNIKGNLFCCRWPLKLQHHCHRPRKLPWFLVAKVKLALPN